MDSDPLRDLDHFLTYEREGFLDALEEMYGYELATDMADGIREVVSALALGRDEDDVLGRLGRRALGVEDVLGALRDELDAWVRAHNYAWLELHSTTEGMLDALDRAL
jgi:hypothetical protein